MKSRINELLQNFDKRKKDVLDELYTEYDKLKEKYGFHFEKRKVIFSNAAKAYNKKFRIPLRRYVIPKKIKHLVSAPFIYAMIVPTLFLDFFLFVYQHTALRLYGIPPVRRRDYIRYDRRHLDYLNAIQKAHCLYCSYVNGLFSYAVEIAGRTERYWCPIKSAMRKEGGHSWEKYFADYGDPKGFKETFNTGDDFKKCFTK